MVSQAGSSLIKHICKTLTLAEKLLHLWSKRCCLIRMKRLGARTCCKCLQHLANQKYLFVFFFFWFCFFVCLVWGIAPWSNAVSVCGTLQQESTAIGDQMEPPKGHGRKPKEALFCHEKMRKFPRAKQSLRWERERCLSLMFKPCLEQELI